MSISLIKELERKVVISLKKFTDKTVEVEDVNLILDVSGSTANAYMQGKIQRIVFRILPIATKLTKKQKLNVWVFSSEYKRLIPVDIANYVEYVDKEIVKKGLIGGGTYYAGVMEAIYNLHVGCLNFGFLAWIKRLIAKFFGKAKTDDKVRKLPILNIFITDGDNADKFETEKILIKSSREAMFWQFCGVYSKRFDFLERLDTLPGTFVDNASFFQVNDIDDISDEELYDRFLKELPSWIEKAAKEGIL
jgi:hypothetical protein